MVDDFYITHSKKERPTLINASRCLNACKKVIKLQPNHEEAWIRGGRILSDELGMYDKALEWWHERRKIESFRFTSRNKTVALLADLGLYHQSLDDYKGFGNRNETT